MTKLNSIALCEATEDEAPMVMAFDHALNPAKNVKLHRKAQLLKAIKSGECFLILLDGESVGFLLFDYRFFDRGWIELILVEENHRGKGIGVEAMQLICERSKTERVFTSTNSSNKPMQKALKKAGFTFAGELVGLDEGDPEWFYFKDSLRHSA